MPPSLPLTSPDPGRMAYLSRRRGTCLPDAAEQFWQFCHKQLALWAGERREWKYFLHRCILAGKAFCRYKWNRSLRKKKTQLNENRVCQAGGCNEKQWKEFLWRWWVTRWSTAFSAMILIENYCTYKAKKEYSYLSICCRKSPKFG